MTRRTSTSTSRRQWQITARSTASTSPPNSSNFKSLVWYSPEKFEAKGYEVPTTWDELMALCDRSRPRREAVVRWHRVRYGDRLAGDRLAGGLCPARAGPDVYDQWVTHDVKFSRPQIAKSMRHLGELVKNPD